MLELKNITKVYEAGTTQVEALKGIDIAFRESEFVAILGQSGCGKTTLLNIIGGLDRYTSGDLIINGRSTKEYDDRDWDTYRNHSIGFVFQSYNLIPHQSVLANVELALTLSGVSGEERRARAVEALEKVGLGDQLDKAPNQMSGGQMQRVAIARAIVNNPDILLADEPTGALDSETSVQIMNLLQEIAKDKLIIMVTHNPELASKYATRTVRLLDGRIVGDDNPCTESETSAPVTVKVKEHTSMSFATAMSLSLHNLMTKKARTLLTAFAGSIGIIGIAAILALVFVLAAGIWAYTGVTGSYYLGTYQGNVAVWRGLPGKPLGLKLHWLESETSIKLSDLPEDTQNRLKAGIPQTSVDDAQDTISKYRHQIDEEQTRQVIDAQTIRDNTNQGSTSESDSEKTAEQSAEAEASDKN